MRFVKLVFILIIMSIGAALAVMNAEVVQLNYYFDSIQLPLSVVIVGALVAGAVLGLLAAMGGFIRLKRQNGELKRKARLASQEVNNLRTIPIKD